MCRQKNALRSNGVNSHLCGLTTSESARPAPASTCAWDGRIAATPPYAASTCSQRCSRSQMSAIAGTGSMLVVDVVPTVATTASGRRPLRRSSSMARSSESARIRKSASTAILRTASWPRPIAMADLSTEECAS